MKITFVYAVVLLTSCLDGCTQPRCTVRGKWIIEKGRIENFELTNPYIANRIDFKRDTVTLASGFFYNTEGADDPFVSGRFPFVYYGNQERFRVVKDLIFIYRKPYNEWIAFKFSCLEGDKMQWIGQSDTLLLKKDSRPEKNIPCKIKFVKMVLFSSPMDIYKVSYKVRYSSNDKLIFQPLDSLNKESTHVVDIKLRTGTFERICRGFDWINLQDIKPEYLTEESDSKSAEIEIGLENGTIIKTFIQNIYFDYPEELRLALIPILYGHQQYIDPMPPKKLDD